MAQNDERVVPVSGKRDLIEYLERGSTPRADWRIGTEHEKIGYRLADLSPLPYDGPHGIGAMLEGLTRFGWQAVHEDDKIIALEYDGQSITLEPGGQFELSGAPLATVHQTCDEVNVHLDQVRSVAAEMDVGFVGIGIQPKWRREDILVMPKARYDIMRAYMPTKGDLGLDMMLRTCTVQANLDFESEADMVDKFRVALALQPVATALFANSPFVDGAPNGFLSYRTQVWADTDPDRCGVPEFAFQDGMGFERYADYALDVPMYFVQREGRYIDASGQSFRAFLDGKLPALPGERPTVADWESHLTTIFTDVRLKQFLEMRGSDAGKWSMLCALPALWVGLLYDAGALDEAGQLIREWDTDDMLKMRDGAARHGLKAEVRGRSLQEVAGDVLAIARKGLKARHCLDRMGSDESGFLTMLDAIAATGRTPAEDMLESYHGKWHGSVDPLFDEYAY
jgi:glutamate--cysteine ligase